MFWWRCEDALVKSFDGALRSPSFRLGSFGSTCVTWILSWTEATMEQGRGGAQSPLPPEFIESMEISDDEPTRCQQLRCSVRLRRNAPITGVKSRVPDS
ncbi:hypothetical protein AVEN_129453-1 [Araneus ventricosus]|uniref:Uncharacterized protein n=1 Tax=Araneus ventricosus TaxID=182803 RepID=A0A4Y2NZH7_ARAVE|nr:hypothetical protein AVEN_129453-1 [Araneus ventricosus]